MDDSPQTPSDSNGTSSSGRLKRPMTRSSARNNPNTSSSNRKSTASPAPNSPCNVGTSSNSNSNDGHNLRGEHNQASSSSAPKIRRGLAGISIPVKAEPRQASSTSSSASHRVSGNNASSIQGALTCMLCRDFYREPYSLLCGHSFCHECLLAALSYASKCPTCDREVRHPDAELHPNFSLASIVDRYAIGLTNNGLAPSNSASNLMHNVPEPHLNSSVVVAANQSLAVSEADLSDVLLDVSGSGRLSQAFGIQQSPMFTSANQQRRLSLPSSQTNTPHVMSAAEIDREIQRLRQMKAQLELQDEYLENVLVKEFLSNVKTSVEQQVAKLRSKLDKVTSDLEEVNANLRCVASSSEQVPPNSDAPASLDGVNLTPSARSSIRSMGTHFSDFEELYDRSSPCFDTSAATSGNNTQPVPTPGLSACLDTASSRRLASFRKALVQGTRYSGLKPIASIDFAMGTLQRTSCIVSSVAFNSRRDLFALAGVTKEIKVYDYASAVASNNANSSTPLVYPVTRMQNEKNKVSCIAWSPFHANQLGSTDYDGYVVVWDALRSQITTQWNEHDKRCWTIDWNKAEPDMLATGSDDFKVKIWKLNCEHSVNQIEWARSNVCTVDFHPTSRYYVVFGASDHNLYYFDLRQVRSPVAVMRGHTKAVSYARFLSPNEICSASIDGTLRLWDVSGRSCIRSYSGHTNEMNFVGLDTYSNYIVCGSETNEVFVYYKHLRRPLFTYKFPSDPNLPEPPNSFVSALAWNKQSGGLNGSNGPACLLAANSQGYAKLLEFETPNL